MVAESISNKSHQMHKMLIDPQQSRAHGQGSIALKPESSYDTNVVVTKNRRMYI